MNRMCQNRDRTSSISAYGESRVGASSSRLSTISVICKKSAPAPVPVPSRFPFCAIRIESRRSCARFAPTFTHVQLYGRAEAGVRTSAVALTARAASAPACLHACAELGSLVPRLEIIGMRSHALPHFCAQARRRAQGARVLAATAFRFSVRSAQSVPIALLQAVPAQFGSHFHMRVPRVGACQTPAP